MAIPVVTVEAMRTWEEATWSAGVQPQSVIDEVGRRIADRVLSLAPPGSWVLFLAGRGNNGNDARAAVHALDSIPTEERAGRSWQLVSVTDPETDGLAIVDALQRRPAWIVDGLFGIGLNRALSDPWNRLIDRINLSHRPVLAVDIPSGLDAKTGTAPGSVVQAAITLTIGAPKAGLLTPGAAAVVGRLEVARDVGLIGVPATDRLVWVESDDFADFPPPRVVDVNKGDFGHLRILAGSLGYHGAAVLAGWGALRARPGLITLETLPEVYGAVASQMQQVMVRPLAAGTGSGELPEPARATAWLFGPGLPSGTARVHCEKKFLEAWISAPAPVVVDASSLDWLPPTAMGSATTRVVTPHPGEAARLLKCSVHDVEHNRSDALRRISQRFGNCWVVLKGHQTLVGRSAGTMSINSSGDPGLAQGGSGDVLAGFIAGLLAQPTLQSEVEKVLRFAVWRHGRAAEELSSATRSWSIADLVRVL